MNTVSPSPSIPKDIAKISGPLLLSVLLNVGVYGALCGQTYLYHIAFNQTDRTRVKMLVCLVFTLETIQTFLNTETLFRVFVYGFMDVSSLDHIGNTWFSVPILGGVVAFISQTFYAYRIIVLGQPFKGAKLAAGLIGLLALAQIGGAIAIGLEMLHAKQFSLFLDPKAKVTVGFWNGGGALCDITIAVCMTYLLLSAGNEATKNTRQIIERLVRLTLETGTLTACSALLNIILAMLPGEPTYYQPNATVLSKLYGNSILVVLNSRMKFTPGYEGARRAKPHFATTLSSGMEFGTPTERGREI